MHTADQHRTKRPFQPSITRYFHRDDFDPADCDGDPRELSLSPSPRPRTQHQHQHARSRSPPPPSARLAPPVPGPVQADLLQVGMRVRKSVPEGYKTHSKMAALPSIQTTLQKPPTSTIAAVGLDVKAPREAVPSDFVHQRELLPFCGLHKIGGYAEQPTTNIHLYAGVDSTGARPANVFPLSAEAFSQPFSSQGSTDSGYGSDILRSHPAKRSWHDEDDVRLDLSGSNFFFTVPLKGNVDIDEVPVSPLSENPERGIPPVRQFAQPKSRRPGIRRVTSEEEDVDMDGESGATRITVGSGSDFEEADFLTGGEVAMGGV